MTDWIERDYLLHALRPDRLAGLRRAYEVRFSAEYCGRTEFFRDQHKTYAAAIENAWLHIAWGYEDVELIDVRTGESIEIPFSDPEPEPEEPDFDREPEEVWVEAGLDRRRQ